MDKNQELVNSIQIATPCSADWEAMTGDDRKRFCQMCKLSVYNVEEMSPKEVTDLIAKSNGGRVCMQLYRRRDGTVLTRDCPVAVHRVKKACKRWVVATVGFVTTLGLALPAKAQNHREVGDLQISKGEAVAEHPQMLRGAISPVIPKKTAGQCKVNPPTTPVAPVAKSKEGPDLSSVIPWALMALIFASLWALLRKRASMLIIGSTMVGLFAALGYVWSTHF